MIGEPCRPGELAFVIKQPKEGCECPVMVYVREQVTDREFIFEGRLIYASPPGTLRWLCESRGRDFAFFTEDGKLHKAKTYVIRDAVLKPFRPGADPKTIETEEREGAPA
jgi:hypothetical protein